MEGYFFPRYRNGPLQWIKDAVEAEEHDDKFIES